MALESHKVAVISVEDLLAMKEKGALTGQPQYVAIRQKTGFDETAGDAFEVLVYPTPTGADTLYYHYSPKAVKLTTTNKFPYGGADHAEALLACCLLVASPTEENRANYYSRLASSIARDARTVLGGVKRPFPVTSGALDPYGELRRDAGIVLGIGADPATWDHEQSEIVNSVITDGLRQFYVPPPIGRQAMAYQWSFMTPVATLSLVAADIDYTLPAAYSAMLGPLTFVAGGTEIYPPVEIINEAKLREMHQYTNETGRPRFAAIRPIVSDGSADQTYEILIFPTPEKSYTMSYRYQAKMAALTTANPYPLGDWATHGRSISASVKDCAARYRADLSGGQLNPRHEVEFKNRLAASIDFDRRAHRAENFGYNGDMSTRRSLYPFNHHWGDYNVTYEGVLYD